MHSYLHPNALLLICLYACIRIVTAHTEDDYDSDYDCDMIHMCRDDALDVLRASKCILRCDTVMTLLKYCMMCVATHMLHSCHSNDIIEIL